MAFTKLMREEVGYEFHSMRTLGLALQAISAADFTAAADWRPKVGVGIVPLISFRACASAREMV